MNQNQYQAAQISYLGATSVPMLPYTPINATHQYMQYEAPLASNAQTEGQFSQVVNVAPQTVPFGFSYPPQMLFAPQSVPAQAYVQDVSRPSSQVVVPNASPTRPTDY